MPPRLGVVLLLLVFDLGIRAEEGEEPVPLLFEPLFRPEELREDWREKRMDEELLDHDVEFSEEERLRYKEKVRAMFYHAYEGYLRHGYPADELKPLTCEGHDTWGSFSLTLVDALDTLLVLGNVSEFKRASRLVLQAVRTDADINVSVFETNIRIVGGLLAAHMLQGQANDTSPGWPCSGPLLSLAHRMAERLLPAFNTPTGMPYGTVNLKYGVHKEETPITCTAGVGTLVLEFAALSRLTGDERFEKVATRALDSLYKSKSPLGLVGNHISVQTGQWTATDAGIGAGVDSYFEYLVKGALLLRKPRLMKQYYDLEDAILKYVRRGDWFHWVGMNSGLTAHDGQMFQSLEAFWPGMLTLLGDVGDAYRILMNYADLIEKFGVPPEFYDLGKKAPKPGRDAYPLRPEMVESMMYVYRATGDRRILKLAAVMVDTIEEFARTPCGYATVKVKTGEKENRMESFFLAETIKYLYLLFDEDNFLHNAHGGRVVEGPRGACVVEAGGYIFNTEAHPLDPGIINCCSAGKEQDAANIDELMSTDSLTALLDDLLEDVGRREERRKEASGARGGGGGGSEAKLTVNAISEDAAALNERVRNEYIRRQYGSEDVEFEVDERLKAGAEAAKGQAGNEEGKKEGEREEPAHLLSPPSPPPAAAAEGEAAGRKPHLLSPPGPPSPPPPPSREDETEAPSQLSPPPPSDEEESGPGEAEPEEEPQPAGQGQAFFTDEKSMGAEQKRKMAEIMERWEREQKGEKEGVGKPPVEKKAVAREEEFVKVRAAPATGRERRRLQRESEGASVRIALGAFEWRAEEEPERLRAEGVRQIHELKRHAAALVDQRLRKGVNGSKVSLEVIQALFSITEEKEPARPLSNPELTAMLQLRAAVERVPWPEVECKACCMPLSLKGDSAALRALLSSIYAVLYRARGHASLPGPVCWRAEQPTREQLYMNAPPDVTRYRLHDVHKIRLEYTDEAMRATVEQEWELLAVRGQSFLERLIGDGEVLPRRETRAPLTHERRSAIGNEKLEEDDELDDVVYGGRGERRREEGKKGEEEEEEKREEKKDDEKMKEERERERKEAEDEEWWAYGAGESPEEVVRAVFADRVGH